MDELKVGCGGVGALFGEQVFHLTTDQATAAGCIGQFAHQRMGQPGAVGVVPGENHKCFREQRIAGEKGGGLVELAVGGGSPATEVVVVHAREVVVNERVGVNALDCHGGRHGGIPGQSQLLGRG